MCTDRAEYARARPTDTTFDLQRQQPQQRQQRQQRQQGFLFSLPQGWRDVLLQC
jgi:hypothetical protein